MHDGQAAVCVAGEFCLLTLKHPKNLVMLTGEGFAPVVEIKSICWS